MKDEKKLDEAVAVCNVLLDYLIGDHDFSNADSAGLVREATKLGDNSK